jgi:hypothetical protein
LPVRSLYDASERGRFGRYQGISGRSEAAVGTWVYSPSMIGTSFLGHEAKAGVARRIEFYNFQRPHQALENRAPMAVWRAGVTGAFGEQAVDMTLLASEKLGQRCALPTSPQQQQATVA